MKEDEKRADWRKEKTEGLKDIVRARKQENDHRREAVHRRLFSGASGTTCVQSRASEVEERNLDCL